MVKRQLELSLKQAPDRGNPPERASMRFTARHRRQSRTRWWFARMRQVVDDALERQPDPDRMP